MYFFLKSLQFYEIALLRSQWHYLVSDRRSLREASATKQSIYFAELIQLLFIFKYLGRIIFLR